MQDTRWTVDFTVCPNRPMTARRRSTLRAGIRLALATAFVAGSSLLATSTADAQGRGGRGPRDTTRGFPINDPQVIANCTSCHMRDTSGIIQRLSFMRKTPEGWETSVRRMASLNGVTLDPADARGIVRYFSNAQGLAPGEMRPGRFEAERRMLQFRYAADALTERTCRACHSLGRVITQRRTRDEWDLLLATHRGLYPDADFQGFRRGAPAPPDSAGAPHPMDAAVSHLSRVFPLRTPEWTQWSGSMRLPSLDGAWTLAGSHPGRGAFYGRLTITKVPNTTDEFTTRATYRYVKDGKTVTRTGRSIVYTGFQWRGRSAETPADSGMREVMFIEPGWQEMSGRWFRGGYDEIGVDVSLTRVTAAAAIAGFSKRALKTNTKAQDLTLYGVNLPLQTQAAALDFGPGIRVTSVSRSTADSIVMKVDVDSAVTLGSRDLFFANVSKRAAINVYDKVSRIKVTPNAGLARVGGIRFPRQLQQFEATAWHNGADAKPDTDDDFEIGPADVTWSMEEYGVTYADDDLKFVGTLDATGLFTPNVDGPNTQRSGNRNNIGDIWVVATWQPPESGARPIRARAHLVVTVPLYMRFDPGVRAVP